MNGSGGQSAWRTPSGAQIDPQQMPDFSSRQPLSGDQTPLSTTQMGRDQSTPYYTPESEQATAQASEPAQQQPVKVALLVPLTGPQGALGQAMLNAAQLALFDVGASNVTLIPRDTTKGARTAAEEALNEGAQIILGPLFAQDVKAVSPVAASRNIPVIAFSTDWTAASQNTYIMGFLPFGQVTRVVDYAQKRGVKNVAAVIPQTPYGTAVNITLNNTLTQMNLSTPQTVTFANGQLAQAVGQLAAKQRVGALWAADAILLPLGGEQLAQAATALRQNDLSLRQTRILGTGLWDDSPQARMLIPGGWYAAPDPGLRVRFNRQYMQTYGVPAPRLASLAYDSTALAAALAIKGMKETSAPAFDRESLTNPSGFSGLDGVFRFRSDGLVERALAVLELRSSGPVVIDPAPTHF